MNIFVFRRVLLAIVALFSILLTSFIYLLKTYIIEVTSNNHVYNLYSEFWTILINTARALILIFSILYFWYLIDKIIRSEYRKFKVKNYISSSKKNY